MESLIIIKSRIPILRAFHHDMCAINGTNTIWKMPFFKFVCNSQAVICGFRSMYYPLSAVLTAAQVSLIISDTVARPNQNKNDCDCWESPVAKNLRVTIGLSVAEIGCLDRHVKREATTVNKCSNRSEDILKNL